MARKRRAATRASRRGKGGTIKASSKTQTREQARAGATTSGDNFEFPVKGHNYAVVIYAEPRGELLGQSDPAAILPTPLKSSQPQGSRRRAFGLRQGDEHEGQSGEDVIVPQEAAKDESAIAHALQTPQYRSSVRSTRSSTRGQSEANTRSPLRDLGKRFEIPQTQTVQQDTVDLIGHTDDGNDGDMVDGDTTISTSFNRQRGSGFRSGIVYAPLSKESKDDEDESPTEELKSKSSCGTKRKGTALTNQERAKIRALPVHRFIAGGTTGSALPEKAFKSTAHKIPNAYFSSVRSPKTARKDNGRSTKNKGSFRSGGDNEVLVGNFPTKRSVLKAAGVIFDDEEEGEVEEYGKKRGDQDRDSDDENPLSLNLQGAGKRPIPMTPEREETSKTPRQMSRSEKRDLREDLEILAKSPVTKTRTRRNVVTKKSKQRKQLELLRRRRAGEDVNLDQNMSSDDAEDEADELVRGAYDTPSDYESRLPQRKKDEDESEEDEASEEERIKSVRRSLRWDQRNQYDNDFVVDDSQPITYEDGDGDGEDPEDLYRIPIQFTHLSHKKPKEFFEDVVEWIVQTKLNPGFRRDEAVYQLAFEKLDNQVTAYSRSQFMSSSWRPDFVRALRARPSFYSEELVPALEGGTCEACGRSNHTPSFRVQFMGKAYHKETLEEVSSDEDEEDNTDEKKSVDSEGNTIPPEEKEWLVGKFCKMNAETAHSLNHWRHALNSWVTNYLEENNHLSNSRIVEREKTWSAKKKRDYVKQVMDELQRTGEIRALYRDFTDRLETVRREGPAGWKGGRRR